MARHRKRKPKASKKKSSGGFASKAGTKELREYQMIAGKYPPLKHEAVIRLSREFVRGREASVDLDEIELIDSILNDNWGADNVKASKDKIIDATEKHFDLISKKLSAYDVLSNAAGGEVNINTLLAIRGKNILSEYPWLDEIRIDDSFDKVAEMRRKRKALDNEEGADTDWDLDYGQAGKIMRQKAYSYNVNNLGEVELIDAALQEIELALPQEAPKDVIDTWKKRVNDLKTSYSNEIRRLSEQKQIIRRLETQERIGNEALEKLVNHNLQLAMSRISKIIRTSQNAKNISISDLIGAANVGLVLGARQFDPEMGRRFSTYAAFHIDAQLYDIIKVEDGKSGIKGFTQHEQKQAWEILNVVSTHKQLYDREPTIAEIHSLTGYSATVIENRRRMPQIKTQNIYAPVNSGKTNSNSTQSVMLADILSDGRDASEEMQQNETSEALQMLLMLIDELPDDCKSVLTTMSGIVLPSSSSSSNNSSSSSQSQSLSSEAETNESILDVDEDYNKKDKIYLDSHDTLMQQYDKIDATESYQNEEVNSAADYFQVNPINQSSVPKNDIQDNKQLTARQTASHLGITTSEATQKYNEALKILREKLENIGYDASILN